MKALQINRSAARLGLARLASAISPTTAARVGPLEHVAVDPPTLPAADWVHIRPRLSGICGSDLAMLEGRASLYFDPIVSFPFTPGHEIVADVVDGELAGRRATVIPLLTCATRGIEPRCEQCAAGRPQRCERQAFGHLAPGLQCGFCADTGGGWGPEMVVHPSQLVAVPDHLTDEQAVMIEPTACAVHAARTLGPGSTAILGMGTLGLLTLAAIAAEHPDELRRRPLLVSARYPHQQATARTIAAAAGIDLQIASGPGVVTMARAITSSHMVGDQLTGGFGVVVDCVGTSESISQALQIVAPGGTVVLVGMPGDVSLDLTSAWHREVAIRGCYAYHRADFDTAMELVQRFDLGRFVSATYRIADHVDAVAHAAAAGRRGAIKIAFDLREGP